MRLAGKHWGEKDHFDLLPLVGVFLCLLATLLLVGLSKGAIDVGAGAGVGWLSQAYPQGRIPVLIEWDGSHAIWHSEKGFRRIEENFVLYNNTDGSWSRVNANGKSEKVNGPQANAMDPLLDYLDAHRQTHYALIAVRPAGFKNFHRFAARFEARKIEMASEPIEEGIGLRLIAAGEKLQ
jgi:hypothetical protein